MHLGVNCMCECESECLCLCVRDSSSSYVLLNVSEQTATNIKFGNQLFIYLALLNVASSCSLLHILRLTLR